MTEQKWNAPLILPFTEDVKQLDFHMDNVRIVNEKMLKLNQCTKNYAELAKLVLAQVIIFNRRREGEVSRMELATFIRKDKSQLNQDVATCLTPLENKMCDFFTRVETRGKRGRGVPVLLKPSMVSAMELLAESRGMYPKVCKEVRSQKSRGLYLNEAAEAHSNIVTGAQFTGK